MTTQLAYDTSPLQSAVAPYHAAADLCAEPDAGSVLDRRPRHPVAADGGDHALNCRARWMRPRNWCKQAGRKRPMRCWRKSPRWKRMAAPGPGCCGQASPCGSTSWCGSSGMRGRSAGMCWTAIPRQIPRCSARGIHRGIDACCATTASRCSRLWRQPWRFCWSARSGSPPPGRRRRRRGGDGARSPAPFSPHRTIRRRRSRRLMRNCVIGVIGAAFYIFVVLPRVETFTEMALVLLPACLADRRAVSRAPPPSSPA